MNVSAVRIADARSTQLVATIDGAEWYGIACHLDGYTVVIDSDGQIPNAVKTWLAEGNTPAPYTPPPLTLANYAAAVQTHIDAVAQSKGYADGVALASYVASNNAQWSAEATVFSKWRDDVWAYAYQQLAAVQSGARQGPSMTGLVLELPQIDWQAVPVTDLQVALERIAHLENALGEFVSRIESGT